MLKKRLFAASMAVVLLASIKLDAVSLQTNPQQLQQQLQRTTAAATTAAQEATTAAAEEGPVSIDFADGNCAFLGS